MPRSKLFRTSSFPYHVVTRTTGRYFFDIPLNTIWKIAARHINETQKKYQIETHHFILMSNHIHWLLKTPLSNLDVAMQFCLSNIAKEVQKIIGRQGHLWGGRYKPTYVVSELHYRNIIRYIYQNPLRANLVRRFQNYRFSTFHMYECKNKRKFQLYDDWFHHEMDHRRDLLFQWISDQPGALVDKKIQNGLRYQNYRLSKK